MRRALLALLLALIVVSCTLPTDTPAAPDNGGPAATSKSQAASKPAGTVLLKVAGSGTKSTKRFSAAGDWDLAWTYDCQAFGQQGNFQVFVESDDTLTGAALTPVNQLGNGDQGVEHYHQGGSGLWLTVNSECVWAVVVTVA
jgi:hypothetical protein